jgi:ArsR family transcriptional regulator, arsenate/arsenite/antimonite-responsive transcriptional repressor
MTQLTPIFKAISDETRWKLVRLLLTGDLCGKALSRRLGITEAAVSQHLKVLREAGLVEGEKRGYWTHYSLKKETLEEVIGELDHILNKSLVPSGQCRRVHAREKGKTGEEAKTMCKSCCEQPVMLKEKPENCTLEQIKKCHGDTKDHPCTTDKKES